MDIQTEKLKGEIFVLSSGILWAFFPVLVALSYTGVSGLTSFAWSSLLAAIFFFGMVTYKNSWRDIRNTTFWNYILRITFFNAFLFYLLYYISLKYTSPGNVALLMQTEILSSFLFFHILKKDGISKEHQCGILFMLMGALLVLWRNFSNFNLGDILILLAVCTAPIGNYFQQEARKIASAESILFWRTLISIPFLFILAFLFGNGILFPINTKIILLLTVNGILILGVSKIFWIEGIHRISVTKAIALTAFTPLLTLLISWFMLNQQPALWQLISFIPLSVGMLLLTDNIKFSHHPQQ